MNTELNRWCQQHGVEQLVVVSPHLDDGVFSVHTALAHQAGFKRLLATVFSDAPPDAQSDWARHTGFANNRDEFSARRAEDAAVAAAMGFEFSHLNEYTSLWSADRARHVVEQLSRATRSAPSASLALLPAGAGKVMSGAQRWWHRVIRRPFGPPEHGEHLMARDQLKAPLLEAGFTLGYYAELPYVWSDRVTDLARRVHEFHGQPLQLLRIQPDVEAKLVAAGLYRSQMGPILGSDPAYVRRVLSHPEIVFLPN